MISPLLNRLISCRAHLAETLGVHPTRLLDSIALTDCGVSAPAERHLLPGGDRLLALAAEQLLPSSRALHDWRGQTAPRPAALIVGVGAGDGVNALATIAALPPGQRLRPAVARR